MKKAFIKIDWMPAFKDGKSSMPKGTSYVAVSRFPDQSEEEWLKNAWSIRLEFIDPDPDGEPSHGYAFASFISPEAPVKKLEQGASFDLYEGPRPVAHAQVILSEQLIEKLVATAA